MNARELRKKYPEFIYHSFDYKFLEKGLKIFFDFEISGIKFRPSLLIKNAKNNIEKSVLDNFIFHLGLIEMISYYKATCSKKIIIRAGKLNKDQIKWLKNLIIKGLGEFFYINKIDFTKKDFIEIISEGSKTFKIHSGKINDRVLIPFSGGKDSFVTYSLLKNTNHNCFSLNPTNRVKKILKKNCPNSIIVERKIDSKLIELNNSGFLNGHTPFSAYLASLSSLCALLFNYKHIAFSNEVSANEGNVKYLGKTINHQYSKTFDFEKRFKEYSNKYLSKNINYFSFLRPLHEIQIANIFSKYPKYFNDFLSCNEAYKTDSGKKKITGKWCGKCSKCLFIFTMLYPFIDRETLIKIFNKNLFEDKTLIPLMKSLVIKGKEKPFDCVGTKKEVLLALCLSIKKEKKLPVVLDNLEYLCKKNNSKLLYSWNKNHFVPVKFQKEIKKSLK